MPLISYGLQMDLFVENKSGVATKKGLDVGACEIDPNYQGEIHLSLTNASPEDVRIYEDDKITQLVPRVYVTDEAHIFTDIAVDPEEGISEEQFWEGFEYNNRGTGGFGSTGDKAK
jgi:dUTPase